MNILIKKADRLAERITDLHFEANPEFEKYGEYGRVKCKEDAVYHLKYLAEAIEANSIALFVEYIKWAAIMLKSRKMSVSDLIMNLDHIQTAIREESEEVSLEAEKFIKEAKAVLSEDIIIDSFINSDAPLAELAGRYNKLLLTGQRQLAAKLITDTVNSGVTVQEIYEHVFLPSQYEIGRLWQLNEITVAQEHYSTAATQLIMSLLYPKIFASKRTGKTLIATCVSGDLHEIGIRMVSDFFEMEGWDTYFLGSNTPHHSIIEMAKSQKADIIAISATMTFNIGQVRKIIELTRKEPYLNHVKILVGGYPFVLDKELYKSVGADGTANSAREAIERINELII